MQNSPPPQGRPQLPQFAVSELRSAQPLWQTARPPAHEHWPPLHVSPRPQAAPQLPQLFGSELRSRQVPLQLELPLGQPHLPALQI